jgi:isopentenyl-diphosphate delta-isomerase
LSHESRKNEHIHLSLRSDVTFENKCRELFSQIVLIHQALPGLRYEDIDLSTSFLSYELSAPIVIEAMTGGTRLAKKINESLALVASKYRVAIGVGSQRPIIASKFDPEIVATYRVVRDIAREVPVIGNIGVAQLAEFDINDIIRAVELIEADALAVHLNPAQEIIQPEGDRNFSTSLVEKVVELSKSLRKPIIIKEVGNGLSLEVASLFCKHGLRIFDVAGACGTSWVMIEALRCHEGSPNHVLGSKLHEEWWGIPTPLSLVEVKAACPGSKVIASGGVWDGFKAAKMLAIGASMVGFARPLLKALVDAGLEGAFKYLEQYIRELKTAMFLTGTRSLRELCEKPVVLGPLVVSYLTMRGIDVAAYLKKRCLSAD